MKLDLSKKNLPKVYIRKGKQYFLCQIRKHFVQVTEEEKVRQALIKKLIKDLNYPEELFEVEVPLEHFKKGIKGRADIVVFKEPSYLSKKRDSLLLIECKEPNEIIDYYFVEDQIERYNKIFNSDVKIITNGIDIIISQKDLMSKKYIEIKNLPDYRKLLKSQNIKPKKIEKPFDLYSFSYKKDGKLKKTEIIMGYSGYFSNVPYELLKDDKWVKWAQKKITEITNLTGKSTTKELFPYILKLFDMFYNINWEFEPMKLEGIKIVDDPGFRRDKFGYPTGSLSGIYRYLVIKDLSGENQVISFSIYSMYQGTYLLVGLDDYDKKNHSIEMRLDKYLSFDTKTEDFLINHDGRMTIGTHPQKKIDVMNFIEKKAPHLIKDGKIFLGKFNLKDSTNITNPEVVKFIGRLILYSLLRNEFRKEKAK